jgi:hypothetical protein
LLDPPADFSRRNCHNRGSRNRRCTGVRTASSRTPGARYRQATSKTSSRNREKTAGKESGAREAYDYQKSSTGKKDNHHQGFDDETQANRDKGHEVFDDNSDARDD